LVIGLRFESNATAQTRAGAIARTELFSAIICLKPGKSGFFYAKAG
jgi:hypothetical protein